MQNWRKITHDKTIINIVKNCHIDFIDNKRPVRTFCRETQFSSAEKLIVWKEINKLLEMKVIKEVSHSKNEFISPIFVVPKKNPGEYRMILNLKKLNEHIPYFHFKMDTFESALKLVKPGCYMASVDLKHAYYSIHIAEEDQIKLRFQFCGRLYQYCALPNGIAFAPRIFTKLMKPVYASLRNDGFSNSGFIDDSLLLGDTVSECHHNVVETLSLMTNVGFIPHETKSVLVPTTQITFLGNNIDSVKMVVTLPSSKVETLINECITLYKKSTATIKSVARVLGLMVASFSAVEYGRLYYRKIETAKIEALRKAKGDFSQAMYITQDVRVDLLWWIENLKSQERVIDHGNPNVIITCDASLLGWAGKCGDEEIGGRWSIQESLKHINVLEMLAASLSVRAFCRARKSLHVRVMSDNSCTVAYIQNMSGNKSVECNNIVHDLLVWCMNRRIWLSACHIPGLRNVADHGSRNFNDNVEWQLDTSIFEQIVRTWGRPEIDMFASRVNKQVSEFVSWKPDAEATHIDAFTCDWSQKFIYIFCPFSLIGRTLAKLRQDNGEAIMIVPLWPTQNWWSRFLELLIDIPLVIPVMKKTLFIQNTDKVHPLVGKLHLVASRLSGNPLKIETFQKKLPISCLHHGNHPHRSSTQFTLENGFHSVIKGKLVQFKLL